MWLAFVAVALGCDPRDGWASAAACLEVEGEWAAASEAWYRVWRDSGAVPELGAALARVLPHTVVPHVYDIAPTLGEVPDEVRGWLDVAEGDRALAAGDLEAAAAAYGRAPEATSVYPVARYRLGAVHVGAGKLRSAVEAFRDSSSSSPLVADGAVLSIAVIYEGLGRASNAISYTGMFDDGYTPAEVWPLVWAVRAEAAWILDDAKVARKQAKRAEKAGWVPEILPLQVRMAEDPRAAFELLAPAWREERAALAAGTPSAGAARDLDFVWTQRAWAPAEVPDDPFAVELVEAHNRALAPQRAAFRERAVAVRLARVDAALAAAEATAGGDPKSALSARLLDYGF